MKADDSSGNKKATPVKSTETTSDDTPCTTPNNSTIYTLSVADYDYTGLYKTYVLEDGKRYRMRIGGEDNGLIDGLVRDYESTRATWKEKMNEALNCYAGYCLFVTLSTYEKQSFADIQKAVKSLIRKLKRYFGEKFLCEFNFLEPNQEAERQGGWHAHLLVYLDIFDTENVADYQKAICDFWKKQIKPSPDSLKTDKHLVDIKAIVNDFERMVKILYYLNPTSVKKRDFLRYYPKGKRAMWYNEGSIKIEKPKSVVTPMKAAKKITDSETEFSKVRREVKYLLATETVVKQEEVIKYFSNTSYFTTNDIKNLDIHENISEVFPSEKEFFKKKIDVKLYAEDDEEFLEEVEEDEAYKKFNEEPVNIDMSGYEDILTDLSEVPFIDDSGYEDILTDLSDVIFE